MKKFATIMTAFALMSWSNIKAQDSITQEQTSCLSATTPKAQHKQTGDSLKYDFKAMDDKGVVQSSSEFKFEVDYSQKVTVGACVVDKRVNIEKFPLSIDLTGRKKITAKIFYCSGDISTTGIINQMKEGGYRPANLSELITLQQVFPGIGLRIVALGSIYQFHSDACGTPCLFANTGEPFITIIGTDLNWRIGLFSFLAIRILA